MAKSLIEQLQDQLKHLKARRPDECDKEVWRDQIRDLESRIKQIREPNVGLDRSGTMQNKAWIAGERDIYRESLGRAWDNKKQSPVTDHIKDSNVHSLSRREMFILNQEKRKNSTDQKLRERLRSWKKK